ncbi:MAG TPA: hypothetical protein VNN20_12320 [Thermodesulfobacteriota bacterium]|nr:hypothetical protein [Thermodesulfobacteriota bacterium]
MEILKILKIEQREWENIRTSLQECGDIGEFDSKKYMEGASTPLHQDLPLFRNLMEMEKKLPRHGYFTQEAAFVFTVLASKAGERLGLEDGLAQTFGSGYSWVRTGSLALNGREGHKEIIKQLFFFKLFFPVGGFYNWDFSSPIVKRKLGLVYCKFRSWQDNPDSYIQDVRDCREQLEPLWHGLLLALGFPTIDWIGAYETYRDSIINEI